MDEHSTTPTGHGPPPHPVELAAGTLAGPLRQAADDLLALREAWRGLSQVERDVRLGVAADYLRDVKHLAAEAEALLRAFTGFRTPRELAVVTQPPKGEFMLDKILKVLAALCGALATASAAGQVPHLIGTIAGAAGTVLGVLAHSPISSAVAPSPKVQP